MSIPRLAAIDFGGPADAAAAPARPVARHDGRRRCGRGVAPTAHRPLPRRRLGAARPRPQPRASEPFTVAELAAAVLALADRARRRNLPLRRRLRRRLRRTATAAGRPAPARLGDAAVHRRRDRHGRRLARARRHGARRRASQPMVGGVGRSAGSAPGFAAAGARYRPRRCLDALARYRCRSPTR